MNRRKFIAQSCSACLSATAFAALLPACQPTQYVGGTLDKNGLILQKDDFKVGTKGSYSSFIVVRNESLLFPICVYRFSDKDYSAIWLKCAHQGAEVNVVGNLLQCPAHGSEYDNRGRVTNGPAARNLRTFPVVVRQNDIFIDLRKQT